MAFFAMQVRAEKGSQPATTHAAGVRPAPASRAPAAPVLEVRALQLPPSRAPHALSGPVTK
tara:strand:- start:253 stop:435 length:183 start_codon:yes stop_codon:yes gene_type:complete